MSYEKYGTLSIYTIVKCSRYLKIITFFSSASSFLFNRWSSWRCRSCSLRICWRTYWTLWKIQIKHVLCISTSEQVLHMPFARRNAKTTFSVTYRTKYRKKKGKSHKNMQKHALKKAGRLLREMWFFCLFYNSVSAYDF